MSIKNIETIKVFATKDDMNGYLSSIELEVEEPLHVLYYTDDEGESYSKEILPLEELWFEALNANSKVGFHMDENADYVPEIEYSFDKITWKKFKNGLYVTVPVGTKLYCRGNNDYINYSTDYVQGFLTNEGSLFNLGGSISSLINFGDGVPQWCFYSLFNACNLNSAEELLLPFKKLGMDCYTDMFRESTLVHAPKELPALELADYCYFNMFRDCTNLVDSPEIKATKVAKYSCQNMFRGCHSLENVQQTLYATKMASNCYNRMFLNCHSLHVAPELPATVLSDNCYNNMFGGCPLEEAPELPATTLASYCYQGMFSCDSDDESKHALFTVAPELPAISLVEGCYESMFVGCLNLSNVTCLAEGTIDPKADDSTMNWLYSVSLTGTFTRSENSNWPIGEYGIPKGWDIVPPPQMNYGLKL